MTRCVFCGIIDGEEPASVVYRDDDAIVFVPLDIANLGHVLVVPTAHFIGLSDLDEAVAAHLFGVAGRASRAIRSSPFACEGLNVFLAEGEAAAQSVFHTHVHVWPRFAGEDFRLSGGPLHRAERRDLDQMAAEPRKVWA